MYSTSKQIKSLKQRYVKAGFSVGEYPGLKNLDIYWVELEIPLSRNKVITERFDITNPNAIRQLEKVEQERIREKGTQKLVKRYERSGFDVQFNDKTKKYFIQIPYGDRQNVSFSIFSSTALSALEREELAGVIELFENAQIEYEIKRDADRLAREVEERSKIIFAAFEEDGFIFWQNKYTKLHRIKTPMFRNDGGQDLVDLARYPALAKYISDDEKKSLPEMKFINDAYMFYSLIGMMVKRFVTEKKIEESRLHFIPILHLISSQYNEEQKTMIYTEISHTIGSLGIKDVSKKDEYFSFDSEKRMQKLKAALKEFWDDLNTSYEDTRLYGLEIMIMVQPAGGCAKTKHKSLNVKIGEKYLCINPSSTNNNCFFRCFNDGELKQKPTISICNEIRASMGWAKNTPLPVLGCGEMIMKNRDFFNVIPMIIDAHGNVLWTNTELTNVKCTILYDNDHFYRLVGEKQVCKKCGKSYVHAHDQKSCNKKEKYLLTKSTRDDDGMKLVNETNNKSEVEICKCGVGLIGKLIKTHICREGEDLFYCKKCDMNHERLFDCFEHELEKKEKRWNAFVKKLSSCIHYDLETKVDTTRLGVKVKEGAEKQNQVYMEGMFIPVLVGVSYYDVKGNPKYVQFTTMDAFLDFLNSEETMHCSYLNAFNGKSFDHHFVIRTYFNKHKDETDKFKKLGLLINNQQVIRGTIYGKKFWDVSKHTTGSLDDNLKELKCNVQKKSIDYKKIDYWDSMDHEFRKQLSDYLKADTEGLREFTEKFVRKIYQSNEMNLLEYISTSQLAWATWVKKFLKDEHPVYALNYEIDTFVRRAMFGGKTQVYQKEFTSKQLLDVVPDIDKYDEKSKFQVVLGEGKDLYDRVTDNLYDFDGVSLYATCMTYDYPIGKPIQTFEFKENGMLGVYEVDFFLPPGVYKDTLYKILPYKQNGNLEWNPPAGSGVYTSVDLLEARKYGYQFSVKSGFYWEKKAPIFKDYIEFYAKKKKQSLKGTIEYLESKLMGNGLYGKTLQQAIYEIMDSFQNTDEVWFQVLDAGFEITDVIEYEKELIVKYKGKKSEQLNEKITKPSQMGVFVLAYSRLVMNNFYFAMNPNADPKIGPYYQDTDSLIMHNDADVERLNKMGLIGKDLGQMNFDLSSESTSHPAKIIRYIGAQKKVYMCDYLTVEKVPLLDPITGQVLKDKDDKIIRGDQLQTVLKRHVRCKGVHSNAIKLNKINANVYKKLLLGNKVTFDKHEDMFQFVKRGLHRKVDDMFNIYKTLPVKTIQ